MALKIRPYKENEDDNPSDNPANTPAAPPPPQQPVSGPPPLPGKRPAVPRELMSARPAMTKVVPRSPDAVQAASQATAPTPPKPLTPEEEAERQQRIEYLRSIRKEGKKGGSKKWLIVAIVLLLLAAAGLAAALLLLNRDKPAPAASTNSSSSTPQAEQASQQPAAEANFKDYTSTNFALGLKYPADWTLNDAANGLTIISPVQQLPGSAGSEVSGAVVVAIRPQQTSLAEFKSGNAVAVLDSKNVNYSAPAAGQRGTTFLGYLQYNSTTTKGALDSIYITGNAGYKKDQAIPMADVIKVNPLINVYFVQCSSACTPTSTTMNVNGSSWTNIQANTTVETILKSLSLN